MAVAVKHSPGVGSPGLLDRLPVVSLAGVVYVLGSLGILFRLIPSLWWSAWESTGGSPFVGGSLLGVLMLVAAGGLVVLGTRLLGARTTPGLRAGIFVGLLGVLVILLLTRWASLWIEHWVYDEGWFGVSGPLAGALLTAAFGLVLVIVGIRLFALRATQKALVELEQQGWFHATFFKRQQGLKVRRGTIVGLLLISGAGIWTLMSHGSLRRGPQDWQLAVPFTGRVTITDEGDAGRILDERFGTDRFKDPAHWALVRSAGDSEKLQNMVGQWVPRQEFEVEVKALTAKKLAPPEEDTGARLVLSRYDLRDINAQVDPSHHVRIEDPGDSKAFKTGQIVPKEQYDAEVKRMKKEEPDLAPPDGVPTQPASGPVTFETLTLLPSVQFTVPLLLLGLSIWLSWRVVNMPAFADFLIATEGELNKVSWTTQRRLVQDTIVVLLTVVLLTVYLFAWDQSWRVLLSWRPIGVIQVQEDQKEANTSVEQKNW